MRRGGTRYPFLEVACNRHHRHGIIASGYSINGQVKKSMEAGAKGYVGKPYQLADLLNTVREVLDEKS